MELKVMSYRAALKYEPDKNTAAIRIFPSTQEHCPRRSLRDSPNYRYIAEYFFDDIEQSEEGKVFFTQDLAEQMISDLRQHLGGCECILIHCVFGRRRSPGVAIALNELLNLGYDELREQFPDYNQQVYEALLAVEGK